MRRRAPKRLIRQKRVRVDPLLQAACEFLLPYPYCNEMAERLQKEIGDSRRLCVNPDFTVNHRCHLINLVYCS